MMPMVPPRRKLIELGIMLGLALVFYFIHPDLDALMLFVFGFIWNWAASNDLTALFENRRYRMSMLKLVVNLQNLILKPFGWAPEFLKRIIKCLPAGIFWSMVIFVNDSDMPFWPAFVGSFCFELLQMELNFLKRHKEVS